MIRSVGPEARPMLTRVHAGSRSLRVCALLLLGSLVSVAEGADELSRGEYLAHAADCVACHSAPGGAAYAGGRGMGSPLGTIYATNITPDPDTGIGRYSLSDFDR